MAIFGGKIINIVFFFFYMASIRWQHPFFLCIELFFGENQREPFFSFLFLFFTFFFFFWYCREVHDVIRLYFGKVKLQIFDNVVFFIIHFLEPFFFKFGGSWYFGYGNLSYILCEDNIFVQ